MAQTETERRIASNQATFRAIAIARTSIGKSSDTVRYAALAPAEAKKKMCAHCLLRVSVWQAWSGPGFGLETEKVRSPVTAWRGGLRPALATLHRVAAA